MKERRRLKFCVCGLSAVVRSLFCVKFPQCLTQNERRVCVFMAPPWSETGVGLEQGLGGDFEYVEMK